MAVSKSHFPLSTNKLSYKQLGKSYSELLNGLEIRCVESSSLQQSVGCLKARMNAGREDNDQLEGLSGIPRNWESPVPCREVELLI